MTSEIEKNRHLFVSYNIYRLRQLIRYLSEEKFDLFQLIPFFLHVNQPEYPGYIETDRIFYGIYKFQNSGFFKYAIKKYQLKNEIDYIISNDPTVIQGLYLMGSAGTLTQSEKSDFDYWVVVDLKTLSDDDHYLLMEKVKKIERWCYEKHQQEVTFFIMDVEKIKANDFSAVDSESSGSAQKTLLKEEFYRTFIMLAGKIPLWSVVPSGTSDKQYDELCLAMLNENSDYINTGNLTLIDPNECLGAILWQVYKAKNDPVKSIIKASLIAYYYFNDSQTEAVVCNILKEKFSEIKIEAHLFDPYTIVFEKIILFYKEIDDLTGLHLIRDCIFLRLLGYPLTTLPDLESPKGKLLMKLAGEWGFNLEKLDRLKKFYAWSEEEKLKFENLVYDKLSFIYELILRSSDELVEIDMKEADLDILVNRTATFRQKVEGKIIFASAFLRRNNKERVFKLKEAVIENGLNHWQVYLSIQYGQNIGDQLVYVGKSFLKSVGWLLSNQFVDSDFSNVKVEISEEQNHFTNPASSVNLVFDFFKSYFTKRPDYVYREERRNDRILFYINGDQRTGSENLYSVDYLLINSWGELYFDTLNLSCLERTAQKCYKIAITVFHLLQAENGSNFQYFVCKPQSVEGRSIPDVIDNLIDKLKNESGMSEPDSKEQPPTALSETKHKPFLDIL